MSAVAPQPLWYGPLIALYTVAIQSQWWVRWGALAAILCGGLLTVGSSDTAFRGVIVTLTAYALGRAAAGSRAHATALVERAAWLERERLLEAERAAERERTRIARDLHDILAHTVSLMVVQAEAGPVVVRTDPKRAVATFDAIADVGRDAMDQLRRMLVVLQDKQGSDAALAAIEDLPSLVRQAAGAGLAVGYEVTGDPQPMAPDLAITTYRIVQEALTNIVRHAGASRADVRLSWRKQELTIEVRDNGRGTGVSLPSGGNGLAGIRERVAAHGGSASAGPGPTGFTVCARLPL